MNTRDSSRGYFCALCFALIAAIGCATNSQNGTETTRSMSETRGPRLELGLRLSNGNWLELGDLRGRPVVLFVFATFDMVSQAALKPLRPFVQQHPDVVVVGVASEPRATQLVEAWAYALDPPFAVGADPYGRVENGQTVLGRIETVPTYIVYDSQGYETARVTGYQGEGALDAMVTPLSKSR